jgi:hypothetical protein
MTALPGVVTAVACPRRNADPGPDTLSAMVALLEPWVTVEDDRARALEAELAREVARDHALAAKAVRAVAKRIDNDDVLFEVVGEGYAVVHLTWARQREASPQWPTTRFYKSFDEWSEQGMKPDHDDYGGESSPRR